MRALLVEDDGDLTDLLRDCLAREGYRPTCVSTVAEARIAIARSQFCVALLDYTLLGETSEPLLAALGAVPTVIYSATTSARAVAAHWHIDFVGKPFDLDALLGTLLLARRTGRVPTTL